MASRSKLLHWLGSFYFWNLFLVMLVMVRFIRYIDLPETIVGWGYLLTTWVGHSAFLTFLPFPILLALIVFASARLLIASSVAVSVLGISMLLLDSFVFGQYRFHINQMVISLLLNDTDGQIFEFSLSSWLMLAGGILAVCTLQTSVAIKLWQRGKRREKKRALKPFALGLLACLITSHLVHAWADAVYQFDVTRQARFYPLSIPMTARSRLEQWGISNPEAAEQARMLKTTEGSLNYGQSALQCSHPTSAMNVLMVVVDSWREDTSYAPFSPNIAAFSDQYGVRFADHYSGGNGTRTGIFSLMYGLPGTYWNAMKSTATPAVMIKTLQQQGFGLGIFANATLVNPAFDKTVFASVSNLRLKTEGDSSPLRDIQLTDDWLNWLDKHQSEPSSRPFFGFLFYDAPHAYSYPKGYPEHFTPVWEEVNYLLLNNEFNPEPYFNRYKNAVHFTDAQIGRVLDDLKSRGLLDNTLIVITADHGQEFNDSGMNYWGHGSNFTDVQVKVPMIIVDPRRKAAVETKTTSHLDVPATILESALGCQDDSLSYSSGQNMFQRESRQWLIAGADNNHAVIEPERITVTYHSGRYEVLNKEYELLDQQTLDLSTMKEVMDEMGRFYK